MARSWQGTVTTTTDHGQAAPGAVDHRRGKVGPDLIALVERLETSGITGTRSGRDQQVYRERQARAQGHVCTWCDDALDLTTHDGRWKVELDRVATGRERGRCKCARNCRCGYRVGAYVAAHRICQRPEGDEGMPLRYRLPASEVRERAERDLRRGLATWRSDAAKGVKMTGR